MSDVFKGSRHMREKNVNLIILFFVLLLVVNAKLFKLVERSIIDVQHLEVLNDALEKRETIDELEVVKQWIQEDYALNQVIEVQCTTKSEISEHASKTKDLFTLDEGNLRCISIAKPFASSNVVIVIKLLIARKRVIRMKQEVEICARIDN